MCKTQVLTTPRLLPKMDEATRRRNFRAWSQNPVSAPSFNPIANASVLVHLDNGRTHFSLAEEHRTSQSLAGQGLSEELRVAGAEDGSPLKSAKLSLAKIFPGC